MAKFGQVVLGPPGSGKSTYCRGLRQFYEELGRPVAVVNLDPANDRLPYPCDIDVSELVSLSRVMETLSLGPNGGLLYCMEYLDAHVDWLVERLAALGRVRYILFDCPGQVELYAHHGSFKRILERLDKAGYRLAAVHLVDVAHITDSARYMSVLMMTLQVMLKLELPHVNVLSKMDLLKNYQKLPFQLKYYTEVQDLSFLVNALNEDTFGRRFIGLNRALCDLVEDYSLISFSTLEIQSKRSVGRLVQHVDKVNGFLYGQYDVSKDEYMRPGALGEAMDDYDEMAEGFLDEDEDQAENYDDEDGEDDEDE